MRSAAGLIATHEVLAAVIFWVDDCSSSDGVAPKLATRTAGILSCINSVLLVFNALRHRSRMSANAHLAHRDPPHGGRALFANILRVYMHMSQRRAQSDRMSFAFATLGGSGRARGVRHVPQLRARTLLAATLVCRAALSSHTSACSRARLASVGKVGSIQSRLSCASPLH